MIRTRFSLELPGDVNYVRSLDAHGVKIGDRVYAGPLLLTADAVHTDWPPRSVEELVAGHLDAVFALEPEVALLGTGPGHVVLPRHLMIHIYRRSAGLEIMSTAAACRTFNILVADGRKVVAGLMPMHPG